MSKNSTKQHAEACTDWLQQIKDGKSPK